MCKSIPVFAVLLIIVASASADDVRVNASSAESKAMLTVDGEISDSSRWVSDPGNPQSLLFTFPEEREFKGADVFSGYGDRDAIVSFRLQMEVDGKWSDIPGSKHIDNDEIALRILFELPITAKRIRLLIDNPGEKNRARVKEVRFWNEELESMPVDPYAVDRTVHLIYVNLSGYDSNLPMRFTAPLSADGTRFDLITTELGAVVFSGMVRGGLGDFSEFKAAEPETDYRIRIAGGDLKSGVSEAFRIAPNWLLDTTLQLALQHMIDVRSIAGTHPSAFGDAPWRDGAFFSYEVPSLIMMYLAHPDFFKALPPEINYSADKMRIMDPRFVMPQDEGPWGDHALATVRRYYREVQPLKGEAPDIIQLIHWGIGFFLADPTIRDNTRGNQYLINEQIVEWFAFFLYAHPYLGEQFPDSFYQRAEDFAYEHWESVGLYGVVTEIGGFKGRRAPGHSILPNLMMAEVAKRTGRGDAERFFQAAENQVRWIIKNVDLSKPEFGKGQRMSEHMLFTGLSHFSKACPERSPDGLSQAIQTYVDFTITRSQNMWDFRTYDKDNWSLPIECPRGSDGAGNGWNEPGNLMGFPAICFALEEVTPNAQSKQRLRELAVSHFDNLFGRNPLGSHSSADHADDFYGVENPWPKKYPKNICARLELVRGTFSASCDSDHYPFEPGPIKRHVEGWVAFNAAYNVSLAYAARDAIRIELIADDGRILTTPPTNGSCRVRVHAPEGYPEHKLNVLTVRLSSDRALGCQRVKPGVFEGRLTPDDIPADRQLTVSYGFGMFANTVGQASTTNLNNR